MRSVTLDAPCCEYTLNKGEGPDSYVPLLKSVKVVDKLEELLVFKSAPTHMIYIINYSSKFC